MVPWFNRISGGGFTFGGTFYPIEPNDPTGAGSAARRRLVVALGGGEKKRDSVVLRLRSRAIPPFDYEATQVYLARRRDARDRASA